MKIIIYIFIMHLFILIPLEAQEFNRIDVRLIQDEKTVLNGFMPGLVAPQFSKIDVNGDGKEDLFVFDRTGDVVNVFLYENEDGKVAYRYTQEYDMLFPSLREFALLKDYNGDGLKDIFALSSENVPGIEVWKNVGSLGSPKFEKVLFPQFNHDILYFQIGSQLANLYVSNIDLPAIEDVDGDGDLDIVTFDISGGKEHLYQNMVVERDLPRDSFIYILADDCYGRVYEDGFSEEITLSASSDVCPDGLTSGNGGGVIRHSGSTTLLFDHNGDGDLDMLIGDIGSSGLILLTNGGTSVESWIVEEDIEFPAYDTTVDIDLFLAAFHLDVDDDGAKDLIVAPNEERGAETKDHIWYYRNYGSDQNPDFRLETKNFLMESTVPLGTYSDPCFFDYNADGLMDLIVGSDGPLKDGEYDGGLLLFENTSTEDQIEFTLVDTDYLGLANLTDEKVRLSPAAGDMNDDGAIDLVIGNLPGFLFYFENQADQLSPSVFDTYNYPYFDIRPGSRVKPDIFDLNADGKPDLILGERNDNFDEEHMVIGGVNYIENIGTKSSPNFDPEAMAGNNTPALGGIFTKEQGFTLYGSSAPKFFYNENGDIEAFVGSTGGKIMHYDDISNNIYGIYNQVTDSIAVERLGDFSTLDLADIDKDKFLELVVGTERGGLAFYQTDIIDYVFSSTDDITTSTLNVYPNPTDDIINFSEPVSGLLSITDIGGRVVVEMVVNKLKQLSLNHLEKGVYIVEIINSKRRDVNKIFKL